MIETKRLRIYPATQNQMEDFIVTQTNGTLRAAYSEMLENCLKHPNRWEWYAIWMIEMNNGTHIGELCFKGLDENGVAEIGYGILEEHQCQGYATEAVKAVLTW
ncbi:MAG: GNAT family N-acetyltransferase, partial [Firmicutes bacterium]|nr:GNAT family N-acetyltransferase [Bacillota bacterium]